MTTNNSVNTSLAGQTGTGNFVGSLTPSITTPILITGTKDANGNNVFAFSATPSAVNYLLIANNATGLPPVINAIGADTNIDLNLGGKGTGGVNILGVSTNSNAPSGYNGEFISSVIAFGSAVSMTSNTPTDITSIPLTAGNWDVWGNIFFSASGSAMQLAYAWISSSSATLPDLSLVSGMQATGIFSQFAPTIAPRKFTLTTTTTIFLSGTLVYMGGTGSGCGAIYASR